MASRAKDIGILALELYVPPSYVCQAELEAHDGVSAGKYTIGLGQERLGFCYDNEDVISMCLTVVQRLMEKHSIDPTRVGRLEVGTETVIDKSKSIKTALMTLFEPSGNTDVEGADACNACYGGTAALLNCINWVDSSGWDGRYAISVAADVAVYAEGAARPTGGAGAVAMLIGANAPLAFDHGLTATCSSHVYDFYKPKLASEYPVVDGKLSQVCYVRALDSCYQGFCKKFAKRHGRPFSLNAAHSVVFHSPYNKLVQKATARLVYNDVRTLSRPEYLSEEESASLAAYAEMDYEASLTDRDVEKAAMKASKRVYESKVAPGTLVPRNVGNMYAAALYSSLVSLVAHPDREQTPLQDGDRIVLFSYGSGLIASAFSLVVRADSPAPFTLESLRTPTADIPAVLDATRVKVAPGEFVRVMHVMESRYGANDYVPETNADALQDGVFFLTKVDQLYRRFYARKGSASTTTATSTAAVGLANCNGHAAVTQ